MLARALIIVCLMLPAVVSAGPPGAAAPGADTRTPSQFELLTSKTPLSELAPVPLMPEDEAINAEVDAAICASYRRWRSHGNAVRPHVEAWCPSGR